MDGEGVQLAFCPLLWRANGGRTDEKGKPVFGGGEMTRGVCTRAYDCDSCGHMQEELSHHPPGTVWWVCPACTSRLKKRSRGIGDHLHLPGFYTEGECQNPSCHREDKHSGFLQLILGDIRKESG